MKSTYDLRQYKIETADKMPQKPHFAILTFEPYSISHEGDERSRTNPGHGYPASTETGVRSSYYAFDNSMEWEAALLIFKAEEDAKRYDKVQFRGIRVGAIAKLTTKVEVSIDLDPDGDH